MDDNGNGLKGRELMNCCWATAGLGALLVINYGLIGKDAPTVETMAIGVALFIIWAGIFTRQYSAYKNAQWDDREAKFAMLNETIEHIQMQMKQNHEEISRQVEAKIAVVREEIDERFMANETIIKEAGNLLQIAFNSANEAQKEYIVANKEAILDCLSDFKHETNNMKLQMIESQAEQHVALMEQLGENQDIIQKKWEEIVSIFNEGLTDIRVTINRVSDGAHEEAESIKKWNDNSLLELGKGMIEHFNVAKAGIIAIKNESNKRLAANQQELLAKLSSNQLQITQQLNDGYEQVNHSLTEVSDRVSSVAEGQTQNTEQLTKCLSDKFVEMESILDVLSNDLSSTAANQLQHGVQLAEGITNAVKQQGNMTSHIVECIQVKLTENQEALLKTVVNTTETLVSDLSNVIQEQGTKVEHGIVELSGKHEKLLQCNKHLAEEITISIETYENVISQIMDGIQEKMIENQDAFLKAVSDTAGNLSNELFSAMKHQMGRLDNNTVGIKRIGDILIAVNQSIDQLNTNTERLTVETKTDLQRGLEEIQSDGHGLLERITLFGSETKKLNDEMLMSQKTLIGLINKQAADVAEEMGATVHNIDQIDERIAELDKELKAIIESVRQDVADKTDRQSNWLSAMDGQIQRVQSVVQNEHTEIKKSLMDNVDSLSQFTESIGRQLALLEAKLVDMAAITTIGKITAENAQREITYANKEETETNITMKKVSGNAKRRLESEIPKWTKKDPNRVENLKDEATGMVVKNTYRDSKLMVSEMMKNEKIAYVLEFDIKGHKVRSKSFDGKGQVAMEIEFHPNEQIAQRKEAVMKNGKRIYDITKFDMQGHKL